MRGYSGPRFGVQFTRDGLSPEMFITEPYYKYLHTLSPLQQITYAEKLAEDVNSRFRSIYLQRYGHTPVYYDGKHEDYDAVPWDIRAVMTRQPGPRFNTRTHTQYYYN